MLTRTPGFSVWNPIVWPGHHGGCCACLGTLDGPRHAGLPNHGAVRAEAAGLARELAPDWTADDMLECGLSGSITLHLFQCPQCSTYRLSRDGT